MKYDKDYIEQSEFKPGDGMALWCGLKVIHSFEEYTGPFDFVARVAVFTDGTKMSLERGHYYNRVTIGR
jgi:hypothetical protein